MFGFRCHVNEFLVGNIVSRSSFTTFQSVSCLSWRASDTVKVCGQVRKERWWLCWWPRLRDEVSQNGPHTPLRHHSSAEGTVPSREDPELINNHTLLNPHMQCCLLTLLPPKDPSWRTQSTQQNTCCLLERASVSVHNEAMRRGEKFMGWPCACTLPLQEVNQFTCF